MGGLTGVGGNQGVTMDVQSGHAASHQAWYEASRVPAAIRFAEVVKQAALLRAGNRCECVSCQTHEARCGKSLKGMDWSVQPVIPAWAGGTASVGNCEVLCHECHSRVVSIDGFIESLLTSRAEQLGVPACEVLRSLAHEPI